MILCIGLIIAVYTANRLGLESVREFVPTPPLVEAKVKLYSTLAILVLTACMIFLHFRGGESLLNDLIRL